MINDSNFDPLTSSNEDVGSKGYTSVNTAIEIARELLTERAIDVTTLKKLVRILEEEVVTKTAEESLEEVVAETAEESLNKKSNDYAIPMRLIENLAKIHALESSKIDIGKFYNINVSAGENKELSLQQFIDEIFNEITKRKRKLRTTQKAHILNVQQEVKNLKKSKSTPFKFVKTKKQRGN